MKINYFDMLSGDSIPIDGVGHIHSPRLSELKPTTGVGFDMYASYLNILHMKKEDLLGNVASQNKFAVLLEKSENLTYFDFAAIVPPFQEMLQKALSFFFDEKLTWDIGKMEFITEDKNGTEVGKINRDNFQEVSDAILQINFIETSSKEKPKKASPKAEDRWAKAQEYLEKQKFKKPQEGNYNLGNMISKLCSVHKSYNLLNVWDLTVFQFYDQFYQACYLKSTDLGEMVFSNHGGKDFKLDAWLEQIYK